MRLAVPVVALIALTVPGRAGSARRDSSSRASRTARNVVNVDGGGRAAYPR